MCQRVTCRRCGKVSWTGCGLHVEQVLAGVPQTDLCTCPPAQRKGVLSRLVGR